MKKQLMWLVQFWGNPASVFKQVLVTKGTWMLPFMLIIFSMVLSRIYFYQTADINGLYMECQNNAYSLLCPGFPETPVSLADAAEDIAYTDDQEAIYMENSLRGDWAKMLMVLPNSLFVISFLLFMTERFFSKTRHTVGQWFAVNNWCWLPMVIAALAYSLHFAITDEYLTMNQLDVFKLSNYFPGLDDPRLRLLFTKLSLMHIFAIFYMTIAFKVMTEKSWYVSVLAMLTIMPAMMSFIFFMELF